MNKRMLSEDLRREWERVERLENQVAKLRLAVRWALGEAEADGHWFGTEVRDPGRHWWRAKLRRLADL